MADHHHEVMVHIPCPDPPKRPRFVESGGVIVEAPIYACSVVHMGPRIMACNDEDCTLPRADNPE